MSQSLSEIEIERGREKHSLKIITLQKTVDELTNTETNAGKKLIKDYFGQRKLYKKISDVKDVHQEKGIDDTRRGFSLVTGSNKAYEAKYITLFIFSDQ